MKKGCAIPGCTDPCRSGQLMCKWHWRKVPAVMKAAVMDAWKAIQGGQDKPAHTALANIVVYRAAVDDAVADVCRQEGLRHVG